MKLGHSIDDGALTVVEQIPGLVEYSDQTQALRRGNNRSFFSVFYSICFIWTFVEFILPAACLLQDTGRPIMFPSTRRSTC